MNHKKLGAQNQATSIFPREVSKFEEESLKDNIFLFFFHD
jgi:hypothetical protein